LEYFSSYLYLYISLFYLYLYLLSISILIIFFYLQLKKYEYTCCYRSLGSLASAVTIPFFYEPGGALAPIEVSLKVKAQIYSTKPDERREEES
jgi:hypothetical protein